MKTTIALFFIGIIVVFMLAMEIFGQKEWEVEVVFCDSRPHKIVRVWSVSEPNTHDITNGYADPVTTWEGNFNVCELKTIRQIKK